MNNWTEHRADGYLISCPNCGTTNDYSRIKCRNCNTSLRTEISEYDDLEIPRKDFRNQSDGTKCAKCNSFNPPHQINQKLDKMSNKKHVHRYMRASLQYAKACKGSEAIHCKS